MFLKVNIDHSISACQHPVHSSGSVEPTGQLCSHFLWRSSETQVVVQATSEMHSQCVGKMTKLIGFAQAIIQPVAISSCFPD